VIVGDKNNVKAKPQVPGLALKPATTLTPLATPPHAAGGSATARAVLQNTRDASRGDGLASIVPALSSGSRSEAGVYFFEFLKEDPPENFTFGLSADVRAEMLESAELSFADMLKLGTLGDAGTGQRTSTTVKGKKAELEKLFSAAYSRKPVPDTPYKESPKLRPFVGPGTTSSSTADRTDAATGGRSSASSTTQGATGATSANGGGYGAPLPPLPAAPKGQSRPRSGSQPLALTDWTDSPQGPRAPRSTRIIPTRIEYGPPRVTSTTSKPAPTTARQTTVSSSMPATDEQSRKTAVDAEVQRLAAKAAHMTATSASAESTTSTTRPFAKVARASDPRVCFENPPPPGCKWPSIVVLSGSWFITTQRYNQIGTRLGKSDNVLPAYESFLPGAPAEVKGDGKWSEVIMHFQRSEDVAEGAGKTSLNGTRAKSLFRGNPTILWNGKKIFVYEPMSQFVVERLKASRFFKYVRTVLEKIDVASDAELAKFARDIAQSFCSDNLLAKMPADLVNELIHLDQEVIKWALDSGCAPGEIAKVRRDVAISFLVTKGTVAIMTQGDGEAKDASPPRSGGVLMRFGGMVAKEMKAVMTFPNSGKALSERILEKSLAQMMSEQSLAPDWKVRLAKLKSHEEAPRVNLQFKNPNSATDAGTTSTTALPNSGPGSKSNPKQKIRRAGTAGNLALLRDPDDLSGSARAEKKRLLKEFYATPGFKKNSDPLKKIIRGALRELDAKKITAEIVQKAAEKCVTDYQEKKRLIKECRGQPWFKEMEEGDAVLGAAIVEALHELDADGLNREMVEVVAKTYAVDYLKKGQLIATYTLTQAFEEMGADLKSTIFRRLQGMDAAGLTADKVRAEAEKCANELIGRWGRKTPLASPGKTGQDSEASSAQSPSRAEGASKVRSPQSPFESEKERRASRSEGGMGSRRREKDTEQSE
jgi:hypothetical protein